MNEWMKEKKKEGEKEKWIKERINEWKKRRKKGT